MQAIKAQKYRIRQRSYQERSLTDAAKEARSSIKASRKENEEKFSNLEGQLYGAGIAD